MIRIGRKKIIQLWMLFLLVISIATGLGYAQIATTLNTKGTAKISSNPYLYYKIAAQTIGSDASLSFSGISNTSGVYTYSGDGSSSFSNPVYYYRGDISNNYVIYSGYCWQIIRTTDTGGVKMIYAGTPTNGVCTAPTGSNGESLQIGYSQFQDTSDKFTDAYFNTLREVSLGHSNMEWWALKGYTLKSYSANYSTSLNNLQFYVSTDECVNYNSSTYYLNDIGNNSGCSPVMINKQYASKYKELAGRYTCFGTTASCSTIYYIYKTTPNELYYVELTGGTTKKSIMTSASGGSQPYHFCKTAGSFNNTYNQWMYGDDCVTYTQYDLMNDWYIEGDYYYTASGEKSLSTSTPAYCDPTSSSYNEDYWCKGYSKESIAYILESGGYYYSANNASPYIYYRITYFGIPYLHDEYYQLQNQISYISIQGSAEPYSSYLRTTIDANVETTYNAAVVNTYIKNNFYSNLTETSLIETTPYCIDRSVFLGNINGETQSVGLGGTLYYGAYGRANNTKKPTLACSSEDIYYSPYGLISADEVMLAGGAFDTNNTNYYLQTGTPYWTISPRSIGYQNSYVFSVGKNGGLATNIVTSSSSAKYENAALIDIGVRPTITLKTGTKVSSGTGLASNPYIIKVE